MCPSLVTGEVTTSTVGTVCTSTITGEEATTSTVGTLCTSTVTGEESKRYISSLLVTTEPILVDKVLKS